VEPLVLGYGRKRHSSAKPSPSSGLVAGWCEKG
jgi:hypothetical protein